MHINLHLNRVPMVKYVGDDDGEEAKEEHCSTGVDHRVEHPYRDGCGVGEVRDLLTKIKMK